MAADLITIMDFESGEMSEEEIVEMLADMLEDGTIDNHEDKYRKLANKYIRKEILDEDGNINFIKLRG